MKEYFFPLMLFQVAWWIYVDVDPDPKTLLTAKKKLKFFKLLMKLKIKFVFLTLAYGKLTKSLLLKNQVVYIYTNINIYKKLSSIQDFLWGPDLL